jgi:hypothetical protein
MVWRARSQWLVEWWNGGSDNGGMRAGNGEGLSVLWCVMNSIGGINQCLWIPKHPYSGPYIRSKLFIKKRKKKIY